MSTSSNATLTAACTFANVSSLGDPTTPCGAGYQAFGWYAPAALACALPMGTADTSTPCGAAFQAFDSAGALQPGSTVDGANTVLFQGLPVTVGSPRVQAVGSTWHFNVSYPVLLSPQPASPLSLTATLQCNVKTANASAVCAAAAAAFNGTQSVLAAFTGDGSSTVALADMPVRILNTTLDARGNFFVAYAPRHEAAPPSVRLQLREEAFFPSPTLPPSPLESSRPSSSFSCPLWQAGRHGCVFQRDRGGLPVVWRELPVAGQRLRLQRAGRGRLIRRCVPGRLAGVEFVRGGAVRPQHRVLDLGGPVLPAAGQL